MLNDGWMMAETSVGMSALSTVLGQKLTYRLHRIDVQITPKATVATVYDGNTLVFTAYADSEAEALERAKAWVDEQDEFLP